MNEPTCKPTNDQMVNDQTTNQRLEWDVELPNILSPKRGKYSFTISITQITSNTSYTFEAVNGVNHNHEKIKVDNRVTFSDEQDDEIHSKSPVESNSRPNKWQMPDKINLGSSGLRRSTRSEVLSWQEKVYSHSTTVLKSVKQSSKHVCLVLFSSFCATGVALNGGAHSHQVLAKSSSKQVENISYTQPQSAKAASKATVKMQVSADSNKMPSIF